MKNLKNFLTEIKQQQSVEALQQFIVQQFDVSIGENLPLRPIFPYVDLKEATKAAKTDYFFPFYPLSIEEKKIFPTTDMTQKGSYQALWEGMLKDLASANDIDTLYYVLKKYLTCLPAKTDYESLFEHIKVELALANCKQIMEGNSAPYLLFCADISGIQGFIYNIASSKAAKSLKGRSFYLQLLMESIIRKVLSDLNQAFSGNELNMFHLLYSSGGKAYLLLPNTIEVLDIIEKTRQEIEKQLWEAHKESLYVCMAWIPFEQKDLAQSSTLWAKLLSKTAEKKNNKYKDLFQSQFSSFFEPIPEGFATNTAQELCAVTGELISKPNKELNKLDENVWVTELVKDQTNMGTALKRMDFYITYQGRGLSKNAQYHAYSPSELGIFHFLKNDEDLINEYFKVKNFHSIKNSLVRKINDTNFLHTVKAINSSHGFFFYGGNEQAMRDRYEEKSFHELAGLSEDEGNKHTGFFRLGVLRMDVDGMGGVFADGMKAMSLAAYCTISAQLDLFFAGYLNILRNQAPFKDHLNILYAGGDDLFVVGRWDLTITFAQIVSQKFKEFVCHKPTISVSGGIAIVTPKFPISKAADLAGEAEHQAKEYRKEGNMTKKANKNAICFLGEAVSWETEFDIVLTWKDKFVATENELSSGFLQKLIAFKQVKDKHKTDKKRKPDLSYKWNAAYTIARIKTDNKHTKLLLENLKEVLFCGKEGISSNRYFDLIALAARWAELEKRSNKNQS